MVGVGNEVEQRRLGLGQVLEYRHRLATLPIDRSAKVSALTEYPTRPHAQGGRSRGNLAET